LTINLPPGGILTKLDMDEDAEIDKRPSLDSEGVLIVISLGVFTLSRERGESGAGEFPGDAGRAGKAGLTDAKSESLTIVPA